MTETRPRPRTRFVCPECQGENIVTQAEARWDMAAQDWVTVATEGEIYCDDCGHSGDDSTPFFEEEWEREAPALDPDARDRADLSAAYAALIRHDPFESDAARAPSDVAAVLREYLAARWPDPAPAAGAPVCPACGSLDVAANAAARFDAAAGAWTLSGVHDAMTCQACGHEADHGFGPAPVKGGA
jgi:predicted RNA-binding Zn-ribbon protein involved in translation (DUF1610 family)